MKKIPAVVVISLIFILISGVFSFETKAGNQSESKNLDVVLILDNSGSMSSYTSENSDKNDQVKTKWEDAVKASSEFVDQLRDEDACSIFCFEDNDNYDSSSENQWGACKPRKLTDFINTTNDGKTTLKNNINSLSPDFSTPLFDTIGNSMDYIVQNKRSDSLGVIVALTDGKDNVCYQFYPTHEYRDEKTVDASGQFYYGDYWGPSSTRYGLLQFSQATFIIGLDLDAYSTEIYKKQLENISFSSKNGSYYSTSNSSELGAIYDSIMVIINEVRDAYSEQNENTGDTENSENKEKKEKLDFSDEELLLPILIFTIIIVSLLIFVGFSLTKRK